MKNLFLLSFAALLAFNSNSQSDSTETLDCDYRTNEVDDFTGSTKIVMNEELFIAHTDSSLMKYYKKKKHQYLEIECYAARVDDLHVVYFYTTIQTKKAYDYYGVLRSDSDIILKLNDGSTLTLKIANSDYGDADYDRNRTTYSTYCILEDEDIETLKNNSIEKVRVYWSKGYEDYDCDNSDLLSRQLKCL